MAALSSSGHSRTVLGLEILLRRHYKTKPFAWLRRWGAKREAKVRISVVSNPLKIISPRSPHPLSPPSASYDIVYRPVLSRCTDTVTQTGYEEVDHSKVESNGGNK